MEQQAVVSLCSGYMTKSPPSVSRFEDLKESCMSKWRTRWFVMEGPILQYYSAPDRKVRKGFIFLENTYLFSEVSVGHYENILCVMTRARGYFLMAASQPEHERWKVALSQFCRPRKDRPSYRLKHTMSLFVEGGGAIDAAPEPSAALTAATAALGLSANQQEDESWSGDESECSSCTPSAIPEDEAVVGGRACRDRDSSMHSLPADTNSRTENDSDAGKSRSLSTASAPTPLGGGGSDESNPPSEPTPIAS